MSDMGGARKELIKEHLFYEVWMLGVTRAKLSRQDFPDQKTLNSLIESFCVHARNLNEFFMEESKKDDTLKASEFTTSDYQRPENSDARKTLFKKINKQIAHLTRERISVPHEKIDDADREQMFGLLYTDLLHFHRHLQPELRDAWRIIFSDESAG